MFKKSKILKKLGQANTSLRLLRLRACPKSLPAANSRILRRLTTGFMAGLCAFSMLGSSMSGAITASAASSSAENAAFPSADTVITKAATLLGTPYTYGNKGYWYAYDQGQYTPLSVETINNLGIDCSGLVYYTLTQLGYKTSGFSWNNPVPVDTDHWLTVNDNCTITYDGKTSKVEVEKKNIKTTDRPYWKCADGSVITAGSVVVAQNPGGEDHAWIYMGEFDSRNDVISYLRSIGVSESLINSKTVGDGTGAGGTHWRIESNGSEGVVINNKTDGKTATAMNMSAFRITKNDVKFEITKVLASDRTVKISGTSKVDGTVAKYGVYTDKACKNKVGEITIGKDGTGSIQLPEKQYYVKEISAPTGYSISEEVFALKADENVFVTEDFTRGKIKVNKTADDGIVSGREFKVTGNDGSSYTKKTNANGVAEFSGLKVYNTSTGKAITYTVSEINVDTRYEVPKAQNVTLTSGDVDLTVNVKFNNQLKTGSIKINKQSEDNRNGDREFTITGNGKTYTIKTGSDGVAILSDIPVYNSRNEKIVYTISEKNVPVRYVVPADQTAALTADATTTKTFKNILKKFTVEVTKQDSETTSAQGNGTLAGAVYGLYKDGELADTYTTDENGYFKTKEYVCGNYTIQEISPSEGYLLDATVYSVGAEPKKYTIESNLISMTVTEDVVKGNIVIIKHSDDGSTQIETPEVGAEFEVYLKSSGSYANAKDSEKDYLVCDENGFAQTKDMPYGVYTVHQTVGWDGTEFIADFDVNISESGQTYRYLINNANFESYIKVVKVDAESGKNIPYAGAGFKIFDPDGNQVTMTFTYPTPTTIDTFYTDANGQLVTPEKLEYGKGYSLVEVQAPYGYVLDSTPVYFDVAEEHSSDEGGITVIKVDKPNMAQKGTVSIEKTGEVFSGVNISGVENADVIYQPVYEVKGLAGAVYEISAAEDIITPDGTLRYAKGEVVDTVTTDENGLAKSKELYLGKYTVVEITAPEGMVINKEAHDVELTYAGQEVSVTETATSFVNDRQKVAVSLEKTIEKNDIFNIGNGDEMKNISFGLFAAEELVSASGTSIPADGLIEIISLSENGKAVIKTDLPFGSYYVKELATDEHYILTDAKYPFTFSYAGQDTANVEIAVNDGKPIENKLIYGSVSGKKITENGEALGGAVIGLFKADETEFTKENALMTATSQKDGSFSFEKVPYVNWLVREIEQPEGFVLDETSYEVKISEVAQVIEVEIVNEYVHGNIKLTKVDEDYPDNKLTGATFEVYKDVNGDGKLDDADELIGTLSETSTGIYEMKELLYGKYLVRETKAPDGFELDKGVYSVFIEKDETTYEVENKAGVGFINTAMKGNLKIVKTSSDGKVEGFTFRVTGVNGYDRSFTTDKNGEIIIEGLRIGDYTISEVQDSVSASYVLPADKIATVKVGSTTVVEMHNELRDTPKTGDNSNVGLWTALAGLSALGIVGTAVVAYRKKKKEDNE